MKPVTLRIAVGPANSDDLKVVQALTQAFNNQRNSVVRLRPVQTDGAQASASLLGEGKADLAIIRGDLDVPKNALAVATLRKNVAVIWVPPVVKTRGKKTPPAIKSIGQLAGRRIGVVGRTEANVSLLKVILRQYGVDPEKVEIIQFPANEAADVIRHQKADAYLAAGPVNSKITLDAIAASARDGGTPKFLAIDSAEAIAQNHPAYEASEIPAGTFGSAPTRPEEEVKTISFSHHIVARRGVAESTIAIFTRQLFAIRQTLKNDFPLAAKIETPDTDKDATIPVHPGAAAFVDGEEKTFLDRYSDYIWWSLMAASAMGSVGAWFAGALKKDERNMNTSQRDRLLDMLDGRAAVGFDGRSRPHAGRGGRHPARHAAMLRARCDRGRHADRVQHRDRAVSQRRGRPQGAVDERAAKPAARERAIPRGQHRLTCRPGNPTVINSFYPCRRDRCILAPRSRRLA